MSSNLSCLNSYFDIPLLTNKSSNFFHPIYKPDGENILSKFSSIITSSTFSSIDLQLLIKNCRINECKLPTKLISSIVIYSSLTILLFLTCSIIFYIISYSNLKKFKSTKQKCSKMSLKMFCIILLIIIYLFLFIQMIFIIQNLNKTKIFFDKSIEEINREFNSKTLSKHLKDFLNKIDIFSKNGIIINQSKSFMIKIFSNLLNDSYYIQEINRFFNNIKKYFNEIIENENLKNSFHQFLISYRNIINDFNYLNKKICNSIDQNHFQIEQKLFNLLNKIHQQFQVFIPFINQQILTKINFNLFNNNQKIRSSISLIINLTIIAITFITIIPIAFLILIITNYFCFYFNHQNNRSIITTFFFFIIKYIFLF